MNSTFAERRHRHDGLRVYVRGRLVMRIWPEAEALFQVSPSVTYWFHRQKSPFHEGLLLHALVQWGEAIAENFGRKQSRDRRIARRLRRRLERET